MTTHESFKARVRDRMAQTGEAYTTARRVLIEKADHAASAAVQPDERIPGGRVWVSPPEMSDDAIRSQTGRGWDEWCDLIEASPAGAEGHAAVAAWVHATHDIDHWWAQGITVSWERITGRRLPGQMADGTFTANASRTVSVDAAALRAALLDDEARHELLGGVESMLRSKSTSKSLRFGMDVGAALITIEPKDEGRSKVVVAHEKLASADDIPPAKAFWHGWLDALEGADG